MWWGLFRGTWESVFYLPLPHNSSRSTSPSTGPFFVGLDHQAGEGHNLDPPSTHPEFTGRQRWGKGIPQGARFDLESVPWFSPTLGWEKLKVSEEVA